MNNENTTNRVKGGIRWLMMTLLVAALSASLIWGTINHPAHNQDSHYGKPVDIPPGSLTLACPTVPPTVNPNAIDGNGQALPQPRIAGSTTAVVLARDGLTPEKASYSILKTTPTQPEQPADETPTDPALTLTGNQEHELNFVPRSAMLEGHSSLPQPGFFTAQPWRGKEPLAAANVEQSVSSGDYRGLATGSCLPAKQDTWLIGGSTEAGNSTVLQLMNPNPNTVETRIEIWADTGKLHFPRGEKLKIKAYSSLEIPLEAQLPGWRSLALRVTASGGGVAATLRTHTLLGLTPGGVSLVHPSTAPQRTQIIPGVILDEGLGAVRVLNPTENPAQASVEVIGPSGRLPVPGAQQLELEPGVVFDITLGGLPEGNYAVMITSDTLIAAGVILYRQGGVSTVDEEKFSRDHAWLPAVNAGGGVVLGPAAVNRQLVVTNLSSQSSQYRVGGVMHMVDPLSTVVLPLSEELAQLVEAEGLYVAQILSAQLGDGYGIDSLEPAPDLDAARQIYVHLNS